MAYRELIKSIASSMDAAETIGKIGPNISLTAAKSSVSRAVIVKISVHLLAQKGVPIFHVSHDCNIEFQRLFVLSTAQHDLSLRPFEQPT